MYEGLKRGVRPFVCVLPGGRNGIGVFKVLSRNCKLYEFREISPLPPCAPPQQRRGRGRTQEFDECPQSTSNISDGVPEASSRAVPGNRVRSWSATFISPIRPQVRLVGLRAGRLLRQGVAQAEVARRVSVSRGNGVRVEGAARGGRFGSAQGSTGGSGRRAASRADAGTYRRGGGRWLCH